MEKKSSVWNVLQCVFFLLYFIILSAERIVSLVTAFRVPPIDGTGPLDVYMNILALVALVGGWLYLAVWGKGLFRLTEDKSGKDFVQPVIAAGILLLGGMVHTEGTIAPVQFAAYGCLLVAMLLFTVHCGLTKGQGLLRGMSFAYITAFSMAIPVVYKTACAPDTCGLCAVFYPFESIASFALVALFTYMLSTFYSGDAFLTFSPSEWTVAAALDAVVLGLRWHDEINLFVLIFVCLTVVLGLVGKTLYCLKVHVKKA